MVAYMVVEAAHIRKRSYLTYTSILVTQGVFDSRPNLLTTLRKEPYYIGI